MAQAVSQPPGSENPPTTFSLQAPDTAADIAAQQTAASAASTARQNAEAPYLTAPEPDHTPIPRQGGAPQYGGSTYSSRK